MKKPLFIAAAALLAACAGEPTIQSGPDAETSFDGLVKIDNSRFANAWADPDVDFTRYDKILIGNAEFEFRAVDRRSIGDSGGNMNFAIQANTVTTCMGRGSSLGAPLGDSPG